MEAEKTKLHQEEEDDEKEEEVTTADGTNPEAKKKKKKKKKANGTATTAEIGVESKPAEGQAQTAQTTATPTPEAPKDGPTDAAEAEGEKKKKKKKRSTIWAHPDKKKKTEGMMEEDEDEDGEEAEEDPFPLMYAKKGAVLKRAQDNSEIVNLKSWADGPTLQTSPPTVTIDQQFPNPKHWETVGVVMEYNLTQSWRTANPECLKKDLLWAERLSNLRKSAEVHRQVRKHAQSYIRPGIKLLDMCEKLESTLRYIIQADGLNGGQAFPTGCSLNNIAAHWSPNAGDKTVLKKGDVLKIDFGTHINGDLIDSAFTVAFEPKFENLLKATQDATNAGIKMAGIDARLCDVGAAIQEAMESYEVEIDGKTYPVKSIDNLCGHSIDRYHIHAGNTVPCVKGSDPSIIMKEVISI